MFFRGHFHQFRRLGTALQWPLKDVRISENTKVLETHWSKTLLEGFENGKLNPSRRNEKKYILSMFPYPSGRLHIGHMRVYTISDATARYYRLNGYEVIHPIGWDSFGLPAENAARDKGVDPREWTLKNIETMREQLKRTKILFDWEREISTCEPEFFRWTQWIFCKLHDHGLVRRTSAEVNWDPIDKTVLAAEQIDGEGRSWRSGAPAEKRKLSQWMIETPKYAKRLQDGLRKMAEQWGEVADIQSNWIGKCDVWRFMLPVIGKNDEFIDLRIRNIHKIANAEFLILKKSHPMAAERNGAELPEKLPFEVLNGVTGRSIPAIVVDDDYRSSEEFFLNSRIGSFENDKDLVEKFGILEPKHKRVLTKNDIQEMAAFGGYGGYETSRTLTDWVVSRQRGWGTPIPMIQLENGKRVTSDRLPVLGTDRGQKSERGGVFDSDTLDTFFDSAWYYLRYLDPKNTKELSSKDSLQRMPVDVYVGGIEHAAVHMFFARFIAHFLNDIGVITTAEPFTDLIPQGIVRGKTFIDKSTGKFLHPNHVDPSDTSVEVVYQKMSKSKNNGVDLAAMIESEGVDMTRLRLLEAAAPRAPINWEETNLKGIKKLLDRIASINSTILENQGKRIEILEEKETQIRETFNFFVRNVGMCLEVLHLHNTALMRLQGFTNALKKIDSIYLANSPEGERAVKSLIVMLQVFCPHVAAEMWAALRPSDGLISNQPWPQTDSDAEIEFLLMIDGVSGGRPAVDRRLIEDLRLKDLWKRAEESEHSDILKMIKNKECKSKIKDFRAAKVFT
uniref:leucine--tRNA ligase n=1 Tax=Caenorhabditis tropicalis TaxID=1561998 RepID=A0A1I7T7E4_9PELO